MGTPDYTITRNSHDYIDYCVEIPDMWDGSKYLFKIEYVTKKVEYNRSSKSATLPEHTLQEFIGELVFQAHMFP